MPGLNDFSALKGLKKELEKNERDASAEAPAKDRPAQGRRSHTVTLKTRDEHAADDRARELGLKTGCRVTFMDSQDQGILKKVFKDHVEIETDGMTVTAGFYDFIVNNPEEDKELMRRSGTLKPKKEKSPSGAVSHGSGELVVDLHIEKIPGGYDAPEGFELPFQMEYFKRVIRQNQKHRGMRISVVHGVGDGVLRDAVRKEIEETFALSCTWTPGPAGVTIVTVR